MYRPVHHRSRVLKPTEIRYSKIEGESLVILYGIKANKMYLYEKKFKVITYHKPLVPLYNSLGRPSLVRVERHKSKLLEFDFSVIYEQGL